MNRVELVLHEIESARGYTNDMLSNIDPADWFRQPESGITHVAWQVGHLAIAQYWLGLVRIRGPRDDDEQLIPANYAELFGKGSVPDSNPANYPPIEEIRGAFDRVHARTCEETRALSEDTLDDPVDKPHPMFDNKFGALQWCAQHEFLHAGQLGLLRRLFGNQWLR